MVLCSFSSRGPCSIWASTYDATGKPRSRIGAGAALSVAANASFSTTPFQSFCSSMSASRSGRANAAEPMAPGWKREPSSLVQATATSGRLVVTPASSRASSASKAASTPNMPSKRPPVGWLSMCEPLITGVAFASVPSRRTNRLPMASVKTPKPRAFAHDARRLRAAASSGERACRFTPPLGVPPSLAMSACRCHRRSSLTALALLMHPPFSARAIARVPGDQQCTITSSAT